MLHYIVILHALGLNIHSMVTCIYNLCSVSSSFYRYSKFTFGFLMCYLLLFDFLSTALLTNLLAKFTNQLSFSMYIFTE